MGSQRYLIQAKRYARTITPAHVVAFGALVRRERCRGLFIHTGRTGLKSREAQSASPCIEFISGQRLLDLIDQQRPWLLNEE